jgi:preprotein translocase subunit SecE
MYTDQYIFRQLTSLLSRHTFEQCVSKYQGDRYVKSFSCWQQFLCLCFGQLTFRESLRSIVLCLNAQPKKLYHLGFSAPVVRATLQLANEQRDWRIYEAFAQTLIKRARKLYEDEDVLPEGLEGTYYALDATTIDLCLSLFSWAKFRKRKGAIKAHTLLDLRGNIPAFMHITDGSVHDVKVLDVMPIEARACYIVDRGYFDYRRLYRIHQQQAFFIIRAKKNTKWKRVYSHPVDRSGGLRCDQTIRLTGVRASASYPDKLRRVKYYDEGTDQTYVFLTNSFTLTAQQVADLYKCRWQVELFFKWIKQHLRIKVFWGTSENAVRTQIWVAVCTYLMVAIIKKQCAITHSIYEILQILSTTAFERIGLTELFFKNELPIPEHDPDFTALGLGF